MVHVVPLVRAVPAPVPRRAGPTTVCFRVRSACSPARSGRLVHLRAGGRLDQVLGRGPRGRPARGLRVAWAALDPDRNLPVHSGGSGEKAINLRRRQRRRGTRGRVVRRQGRAGLDDAGVLEEDREGGLEEAGGGEIEAISAEARGREASALTGPPAIGAPSRWVHRRRRRNPICRRRTRSGPDDAETSRTGDSGDSLAWVWSSSPFVYGSASAFTIAPFGEGVFVGNLN